VAVSRPSIALQVVLWKREVITLAAAAALFVWIGGGAQRTTNAIGDAPAVVLARWAEAGEPGSVSDVLSILGEEP
jgi:hypothetical protein